jgi:hypothetical protein
MNTNLHPDQRSVGTFGFKMAHCEHTKIAIAARDHKLTLSGLIRGLLREWHHGQVRIAGANQSQRIGDKTAPTGGST